ncbi:MAG TPA: hypothetical protein [Caudoviricetes sp.]|nr:MAG TPA: hypothetical protein [Caudoviricetes sp.]
MHSSNSFIVIFLSNFSFSSSLSQFLLFLS